MKIYMDTTRPLPKMPLFVEAHTYVVVDGEDVRISVNSFGEGREGTDKAFDKLENALDKLGYSLVRRVRVY